MQPIGRCGNDTVASDSQSQKVLCLPPCSLLDPFALWETNCHVVRILKPPCEGVHIARH